MSSLIRSPKHSLRRSMWASPSMRVTLVPAGGAFRPWDPSASRARLDRETTRLLVMGGTVHRSGRSGLASPPARQLIDELLRDATLAPSLHNSQPWHFRILGGGSTIEILADPARMLEIADPGGRAAHIACGAALLNIRIAAAASELHPVVTLLPDPRQPLLLAEVRLHRVSRATSWEREMRAAIPVRRTNREPYSNRPVPQGIRAELAEAASAEGAALHYLDHNESVRIRQLAADAEVAQLGDASYRDEVLSWVAGTRETDGIPSDVLGPRSPEGGEPVRRFTPASTRPPRYAWFEDEPQLAVLSVSAGAPRNWLAAGQALERVWLTATCRGIALCPLTQPLETSSSWLVRDARSGAEEPQMILRLGYGLPVTTGSPRRGLADVVDWVDAG